MKNYKQFFYIFAIILFVIFFAVLMVNYIQMQKVKKEILTAQSKILVNFIESFRESYQKNFVKYNIPINEKTIHLIPIVELANVSKIFSKKEGDIEIKFVSEKPRNPKNTANKEELSILKNIKEPFVKVHKMDISYYQPLYIKPICLKCHDNRNDAPQYIKSHYSNAYGYNLGDLRGMLVVNIKNSNFISLLQSNFKVRVLSAIILYFIVLIVVFFLLKKIEEKDKEYIKKLTIANQKLEIEKQKAQKATNIKSQFLANMSHEIRTPLNAMFGFIKLLKEDSNCNKEYLEVIEKSGENLLSIINDILDLSKIESGKLDIEKIPFNLKEEIEMIYNLFENKANEKKLNLYLKTNNIDNIVVTDPVRLKQIIANLLSNAIKFTPEGKNIYFIVEYRDNETIYVEVKDEGIGIPKDKLNTIFEPFSQADISTTRKYGGTGLGLTISYNLVKLLGGELKVESEEGKGSRFYFEIPAKKSDEKIEKKEIKFDEKFNYHILLVEDNKANQMFMSVILKKLGLTFDIANDGLEAIEMYKKNYDKYDLILMDENMPNMTGSEATKEIRKFEKEKNLKSIFIIALTANALSGDREKFLEIGMDEYISKPIDIEKLKEILRKLEERDVDGCDEKDL